MGLSSEDAYSPYQRNYKLPEQAQYLGSSGPNSSSFVVEENAADEDEDDELERDASADLTSPEVGQKITYQQPMVPGQTMMHQSDNIVEEELYEEEESFECRL